MKTVENRPYYFSEAGFYRDMRETNRCIDALITYAGLEVPDADPNAWRLGDTPGALITTLLKSYHRVSLIHASPYPVPQDARNEATRMMYDIRYWARQLHESSLLTDEAERGFSSKIVGYSESYDSMWDALVHHYQDVAWQEVPTSSGLREAEHQGGTRHHQPTTNPQR